MSDSPVPFTETVIPAQPGWVVVTLPFDDTGKSKCSLYRQPVVAWIVQLYRNVHRETFADAIPVTVSGTLDDSDYALQHGEKKRFFTVHEEFTDEATLSAHLKRNRSLRSQASSPRGGA
jgi:hypothetical protein